MKIARDLLIMAATAQRAGNDQQASKLLGLCVNHPDFNALSSYIMACDASDFSFRPYGWQLILL